MGGGGCPCIGNTSYLFFVRKMQTRTRVTVSAVERGERSNNQTLSEIMSNRRSRTGTIFYDGNILPVRVLSRDGEKRTEDRSGRRSVRMSVNVKKYIYVCIHNTLNGIENLMTRRRTWRQTRLFRV